jgi:N6-adenosine-specific RNA methylase IME4
MTGRYRTIVADPPWHYPEGFARNNGGRYGDGTIGRAEVAPMPYAGMALADIRAMPVGALAHEDGAWLWLWTTNRYLPQSFSVAEAWGFTYRQMFVWHKSDGHPRFPATIAPNRAEYLLVCNTGRPGRLEALPSNVLDVPFNPRTLAHSQKPDVFLDSIERSCPGPYVELFARRARFGWDYWGDQSLGTATMEDAA